MNELEIFTSEEFGEIRTTTIDDEPWFVGIDVSKALGYSNERNAVPKHVSDDDRLSTQIEYAGQKRTVTVINESGLYSLILSSKLPSAKRFKHWVTSEVLPTIRKHGAYMTKNTMEKALADPDFLIQLATNLKEEQEKNRVLIEENQRMKPKEVFADAVSVSDTSIMVGELAKIIKQNGVDIGQNRLFSWLREHGYLVSRRGIDYSMPTQKSMNLGLFRMKEKIVDKEDGKVIITKTVHVTGKGQQYFVNKFLNSDAVTA